MIRALLLDFYGTVVEDDDEVVASICARAAGPAAAQDLAAAWWRAFQAAMAASPFRLQREIAVSSLAAALAATGREADAAALCQAQLAHWRTPPLRPGTRAFLDAVTLPICVVSNIDRQDLQAALDHHALSFTAVVTSDDVGAYKPDPLVFRRALSTLGLRPDEVVHVGDSLSADVAGAHGAGLAAIWVNRRARPVPDGVDAVESLAGLIGRLP